MQTATDTIKELLALIYAGVDAWVKAGKLLTTIRAKNPDCYRDIITADPKITIDTLVALEGIGSGRIYPYLLLSTNHGARRLLEMPYDQQVKYWQEPVQVYVGRDKHSKPLIASKMVTELSPKEIAQVFSESGIRDMDQQMFHYRNPQIRSDDEDDDAQRETIYETIKLGNFRITLRDGKIKTEQIGSTMIAQTLLLKKDDSGVLTADVVLTRLAQK